MTTPTQTITLSAVFAAAAVAAGLALSLVPNIELVTLVVFSAGVVLGVRGGAWVGCVGMILYVLANSALRGFAVSPLPMLAAQSAGMAGAGVCGAWWRSLWLRGGKPHRHLMWWLPVAGAGVTLIYQVLLNSVSAWLYSGEEGAMWAFFLSGMGFGMVQVVSNAIVFAVLAPSAMLMLRKLARQNGWWAAAALLLVLPGAAVSQPAAPDTAGSAVLDTASVDPDRVRPDPSWKKTYPEALYEDLGGSRSNERALPTYLGSHPVKAMGLSLVQSEDLYPTPERWGLGWGRTRFVYDGLPVSSPVYSFSEPPHLPLEWIGGWYERWNASTTEIALTAPPAVLPRPTSQFTLSTGSYGHRTAQFALFRNLGPVNVAAVLADYSRDSDFYVSDLDGARFAVRLSSANSRRWSVDIADGKRNAVSEVNQEYEENTRRLQAGWGFSLGGRPGRLAAQYRRDAAKVAGQPEVVFDGFTAQGEWVIPGDVNAVFRFNGDRRRGGLGKERKLYGGSATLERAGRAGPLAWGARLNVENQEPVGTQVSGQVNVQRPGTVNVRLSLARESGIPAMMDWLDRPGPEVGLPDYLSLLENLSDPEIVHAARLQASYPWGDKHELTAGAWAAHQENYGLHSNPLWASPASPYFPAVTVDQEATILGGYAGVRFGLPLHFSAGGTGRVHNRDLEDIPYLPQWAIDGSLRWNALLFKESLDLSVEFGGSLWGERMNPAGNMLEYSGTAHIKAAARVENGTLFFSMNNLTDNAPASDFRFTEEGNLNPMPISPRTWRLGLTLHLLD